MPTSETRNSATAKARYFTNLTRLDLCYQWTRKPQSVKLLPTKLLMIWVSNFLLHSASIESLSLTNSADRFTELAAIEWHCVGSSRLSYGGFETSTSEFMPSKGFIAQWEFIFISTVNHIYLRLSPFRRHRVFTAPNDSRSFKWTMGLWTSTVCFCNIRFSLTL